MMKLKPYPEYKDSGVEWLGKIPRHWAMQRLKNVCRFAYGDSLPGESRMDGQYTVFGSNGPVGSHINANTMGPCLIVGRKGSFGKINFSSRPVFAIDTTYFIDQSLTDCHLRWLYYLLSWAKLDSVTKDSAIPGLSRGDAYEQLVLNCSMTEQRQIARFLDAKTHQINRYIHNKRQLIKLLQEQKQAVINDCVTGKMEVRKTVDENGNSSFRLQPSSSKMRDSGIEWLGQIPEHWSSVQLGRLCFQILDGPHVSPEYVEAGKGPMFLSARNIKIDRWSLHDAKYISWEDYEIFSKRVQPSKGDVLYTKGGTTGVARAVDFDDPFHIWVHVAVLKIRQNLIDPFFLAYTLNSAPCYQQAQILTRGATNNDLGLNRMSRIYLAFPTIEEQRQITNFLKTETRKFREAISQSQRQIDLIQEYRTRLIADVVTGKVDVRGIPVEDVPEDEELEELADEEEQL